MKLEQERPSGETDPGREALSAGKRYEHLTGYIALAFALFQLYTAVVGPFPNMIQRAIHLGFALTLAYIIYRPKGKDGQETTLSIYTYLVLAAVAGTAVYIIANYSRVVVSFSDATFTDVLMGTVLLLILLEASRRAIGGWTFPILMMISLLYALFGKYIPGILGHRGFTYEFLVSYLYLTTNGVYGTTLGISATLIAVFIIFGTTLLRTGGADTFVKIAMVIAGRTRGGAGKIATVASGMFGAISGSAVSNVATTGVMTIPMMKKSGYSSEVAGAIEAAASSGGAIMPPIMSAAAFIMAEFLGVSYVSILVAAVIPAILYYLSVFTSVHFLACRYALPALAKDQISSLKEALEWRRTISLFLPILVLVGMMFSGYSLMRSGLMGIVVNVILFFILNPERLKLFDRVRRIFEGFQAGGMGIIVVAILLGAAQVIICIINLTGIGVKVSELVMSLGQGSLMLALILAMLGTLVLGMGVPISAAYILAAAVLAPPLIGLGVLPLAAHMFVFYFAAVSAITPPVCAAVFVAASISRGNWLQTGFVAVRLALVSFIVPFLLVYYPSIIWQGSAMEITQTFITAFVGTIALAAAIWGYLIVRTSLLERVVLGVAASLLVLPGTWSDLVGMPIFILVAVWQYLNQRSQKGSISGLV